MKRIVNIRVDRLSDSSLMGLTFVDLNDRLHTVATLVSYGRVSKRGRIYNVIEFIPRDYASGLYYDLVEVDSEENLWKDGKLFAGRPQTTIHVGRKSFAVFDKQALKWCDFTLKPTDFCDIPQVLPQLSFVWDGHYGDIVDEGLGAIIKNDAAAWSYCGGVYAVNDSMAIACPEDDVQSLGQILDALDKDDTDGYTLMWLRKAKRPAPRRR